MISEAVKFFASLGPLNEIGSTDEQIDQFEKALEKITIPISDKEAEILVTSFGNDDCFGLAWSLVHVIETAGKCPVSFMPKGDANEWVHLLWQRAL